jgi:hypothetical protein
LFYGGLVRAKNMLSVLMQVFVIFSLISVLWVVYGYSLAFTGGSAFIGGFDKLFLSGVTVESLGATFSKGVYIPELTFVVFQATFAAITTAQSAELQAADVTALTTTQLAALDRVDHMDDLAGGHANNFARQTRIGAVARMAADEVIGDAPSDPIELDALADGIAIPRHAGFMQRQHFRGQHL